MQGNPDVVQAAARSRVERLERAVAVLGEGDSAEIRGLQAALKEARRAAQDRPLATQVEECQAFIQRSQRRLQRLQEEQVKEQQQLDTVLERMARFREEMTKTTGPGPTAGATGADPTPTQPGKIPELVAEVDRLRARVADMEVEREEVRKKRSRSLSVPSPDRVGGRDVQECGLYTIDVLANTRVRSRRLWLIRTDSARWRDEGQQDECKIRFARCASSGGEEPRFSSSNAESLQWFRPRTSISGSGHPP